MTDRKIAITHGAFDRDFAARRCRRHKVDPHLVEAIKYVIPPGSMFCDLGAGTGELVRELCRVGYNGYGIDGTPGIVNLSGGVVIEGDLTSQRLTIMPCDWAITIEVGEHIPREREAAFVANVAAAGRFGLIVSWAVIGQRGWNHVNCRDPLYVASAFEQHGWHVHAELTTRAREVAGAGWARKLLVFRRLDAR
jgi:hypothetical protein